ncbi:hypothetical protein SRHO_G00295470 [Serrasalmus rhombeus]
MVGVLDALNLGHNMEAAAVEGLLQWGHALACVVPPTTYTPAAFHSLIFGCEEQLPVLTRAWTGETGRQRRPTSEQERHSDSSRPRDTQAVT